MVYAVLTEGASQEDIDKFDAQLAEPDRAEQRKARREIARLGKVNG